MTPELVYFFKVNIAIALFYAFYRLFFYKDTFFSWRRTALLCFFAVSLLYPLLNIQQWVKEQEPIAAMADLYANAILPEFTVGTDPPSGHWQEWLKLLSTSLYLSGVLLLTIRFFIQLGSIIRLRIHSPKAEMQGVRVHLLKKEASPFSFFQWIFIHPESHTDSEISEIITHEQTHVRQYHSIDVLISEVMCIACWFNPFVWLMKREVRGNLEYLADHRVLEAGHDSKSYQYHLLGLTHHKAAAKLSNNFNVLPLKNRIKMMNKQRTGKIGRTKYLLFLPLAALLLIVSNIETVARTTKEFAKEMMGEALVKDAVSPETANLPEQPTGTTALQDKKTPPPPPPLTTKKRADKKEKVAPPPPPAPKKGIDQDDPVFEVVEVMPVFPGGIKELMSYLGNNIQYPKEAKDKGLEGRVTVSFVVDKQGNVLNPKIIRNDVVVTAYAPKDGKGEPAKVKPDESALLEKEALRVVSAMPKWTPGKQRGKEVNVRYTLPIMFRLSKPKPTAVPEVVGVKSEGKPENGVYQVVEEMPEFPGGQEKLMEFLAKSMKYPVEAQKNNEQGRVIVQMVVEADGSISNIKVIRSVSPSLDAEAMRVVGSMPKWKPGRQKGKAVAVKYTLPITFRLQKPPVEPQKK